MCPKDGGGWKFLGVIGQRMYRRRGKEKCEVMSAWRPRLRTSGKAIERWRGRCGWIRGNENKDIKRGGNIIKILFISNHQKCGYLGGVK